MVYIRPLARLETSGGLLSLIGGNVERRWRRGGLRDGYGRHDSDLPVVRARPLLAPCQTDRPKHRRQIGPCNKTIMQANRDQSSRTNDTVNRSHTSVEFSRLLGDLVVHTCLIKSRYHRLAEIPRFEHLESIYRDQDGSRRADCGI